MAKRPKLTKEEYNRRRRERYAENREKINERRRFLYAKKVEKKKARSEASKRGHKTRNIKKWVLKKILPKDASSEYKKITKENIERIFGLKGTEWEVITSGYWKQFREEYTRRKK